MNKMSYTYILVSQRNGTLYTGVTSNLVKRVWEHKEGIGGKFTKDNNVKMLVHFEQYEEIGEAIHREKRLKKYTRKAKLKLIESNNPNWNDLYDEICN